MTVRFGIRRSLLGFFVVGIVFLGGPLASAREFGDSIVAMVGDRVITVYELHRLSQNEEESLRRLYSGDELTAKIIELRRAVAREIVDRELLALEFDALKAVVPKELVQERVDRAVRQEAAGNRIEFERRLAEAGLSIAEFEERLRKDVAADLLLREKVTRRTRISPRQIEEFYRDHGAELARPERVRLEVIVLRTDAKGRYAGRVESVVADIRSKLREGTPFGEMAKTYSEDASAENGGDRGWMEDLNEQLKTAIEGLTPGQVSPLDVTLGDKIYIVRLAEKQGGGIPPLDESLRRQIEERLRRADYQARYDAYLGELRQKYYVVSADDLAQ